MKMQYLLFALLTVLVLTPVVALAQGGGGLAVPAPQFAGTANPTNLYGSITTIINVLLTLAALVAAIYLILGGVRYITSRGDEDAAGEAKNTILYAVIGLIVIGLSAAIVNFVLSAVVGSG